MIHVLADSLNWNHSVPAEVMVSILELVSTSILLSCDSSSTRQSVHSKQSLRDLLASRDSFLNERVVTGSPITPLHRVCV